MICIFIFNTWSILSSLYTTEHSLLVLEYLYLLLVTWNINEAKVWCTVIVNDFTLVSKMHCNVMLCSNVLELENKYNNSCQNYLLYFIFLTCFEHKFFFKKKPVLNKAKSILQLKIHFKSLSWICLSVCKWYHCWLYRILWVVF